MKRKIVALLLALCLVMLCSVTALAATTQITAPNDKIIEKVEYDAGSANVGKSYVLLVTKMPKNVTAGDTRTLGALTVDSVANILYIDQAVADTNGKVTFQGFPDGGGGFTGFQLKSFTSADFYVAGESLEQPVHTNFITVPGVPVGGSIVRYRDDDGTATLKLVDTSDNEISATTLEDGSFSFDTVPSDTYSLVIEKNGYCKVKVTGVPVDEEITLDPISIEDYAGDTNGDNYIDMFDLSNILIDFFNEDDDIQVPGCDIIPNSTVDMFDLNCVLVNFFNGDDISGEIEVPYSSN